MKQIIKNIIYLIIIVISLNVVIYFYGAVKDLRMIILICMLFIQYTTIKYAKKYKFSNKENLLIFIYTLIFSIFTSIYRYLYTSYDISFYFLVLSTFCIIFFNIFRAIYVWIYINNKEVYISDNKMTFKRFKKIWIGMFLLWIPYYIVCFPALFNNDTVYQLEQAVGVYEYTSHHPIVTTLFMKFFLSIPFINETIAIGLYSLFQMIIMSLIFTYVIYVINKLNVSKKWLNGIFIYFSLFNLHAIYSITLTKDILYTGGMVLLATQLLYIYISNGKILKNIYHKLIIVVSILIICLFRNNGIYCMIATAIVITIVYFRHKKLILIVYSSIIGAFIINMLLLNSFNVIRKVDFVEKIGIPINQVAATVVQEDVDKEDLELIEKVMPLNVLKETYRKYSVDVIKFNDYFDNEALEENKKGFIKLWIKLGVKYPKTYLLSFLNTNRSFWDTFTILCYESNIQRIPVNSKDIDLIFYNSSIYYIFNSLVEITNIVFIILFNYAILAWILIFTIVISIIKKNYYMFCILFISFINWTTIMLATPVAVHLRYVYFLYTMVPFMAVTLFFNIKNNKINEENNNER